jgi:hypothetical protein
MGNARSGDFDKILVESQNFDIIVFGLQEATWFSSKEKRGSSTSLEGEAKVDSASQLQQDIISALPSDFKMVL